MKIKCSIVFDAYDEKSNKHFQNICEINPIELEKAIYPKDILYYHYNKAFDEIKNTK